MEDRFGLIEHRFKTDSPKLRILALSGSGYKDGLTYLIDALFYLKQTFKDFEVRILGEDQEELKFHLKDCNLQNEVVVIPESRPDVLRWYLEEADLFVVPSLEVCYEALVLQAISLKTYVITTEIPLNTLRNFKEANGVYSIEKRSYKSIYYGLLSYLKLSESELEAWLNNAKRMVQHIEDITVFGNR